MMLMKPTYLLFSSLILIQPITHATPSCAEQNPQGPAAVLECAALENHFDSAKQFWEEKLFHPKTLDGYCQTIPTGLNTAQTELFKRSCQHEKGTYFAYDTFIAADAVLANKLGNQYKFMRNDSYAVNTAELANFLATAAQETTGNGVLPIKYQQDGLYYRSEYSYLSSDTCFIYAPNPGWTGEPSQKSQGTNCGAKNIADYYTNYYPLSSYAVAMSQQDPTLMYTKFVMDQDAQYNLNTPKVRVTFPGGKPTLYDGGTYLPPEGTNWQYMNQTLEQGLWIGLGNLQLTSVSMTQFFGWYHQNIIEGAPIDFANFNEFVSQYLGDGLLAWEGGLYYWNARVSGANQPTLHEVLTGPNDACHDIGLTTYLINGGCNQATERTLYYKYFKTDVFKQPSTGVTYTYDGVTSNSMTCSANLAKYCTTP